MGKDIIPQDKPSKLRKQAEKKLEIGLKDPKEKTDLSKRVPHLAFRLKGLRERQEAESFKEYMVRHGLGR